MSKLNLDEFEKTFLYNCANDSEYISLVAPFTKTEFFQSKHRGFIYEKIKSFYEKRSSAPSLVEIKNTLNSDEEMNFFKKVVLEFKEINGIIFNKKELSDNTERFLKERALHGTLMSIAGDIRDGKALDTSDVLDKFEKNCNINLVTDIGLDFFHDVNKIALDLIKSDPVISSGWDWIDNKIDGGFRSEGKALYLFAGQTNVGKSIVLGNLAVNIANSGRTVVLISLEMSEMVYARRLGSNLSKIPIKNLAANSDKFVEKMNVYSGENCNSRIIIKEFAPSTITPRSLEAFLKSLINRGINFDAVVLDYINLLTTTVGDNSYERVKHIAEQIRALSYVFTCPFITATQLARSGFDIENPDLTTISESIGLAATADFIASVYQQEGDNMNNRLRLGLMKNRWGTNSGSNIFGIDYSTLSIYEDDSLNDEENQEIENASRVLNDGD
jgi:replicative DNA helicase